jgi:hypothetical protein
MSTRARVAIALPGKLFKSVYVHNCGKPRQLGATLQEHYTTPEKVERLIALGDLSWVGPDIGEKHDFDAAMLKGEHPTWTLAYHRDRRYLYNVFPWADLKPAKHRSFLGLARYARATEGEHLYVWHDDVWLYAAVPMLARLGRLPRWEEMVVLTRRLVLEDTVSSLAWSVQYAEEQGRGGEPWACEARRGLAAARRELARLAV